MVSERFLQDHDGLLAETPAMRGGAFLEPFMKLAWKVANHQACHEIVLLDSVSSTL